MYLYLISSLFFLAGCASAPKQTANFKTEYVGETNSLGHSSKSIEENLTRSSYNSLLGDAIAAYPYRGAIIEASLKETGARNLDNADKVVKEIEKSKQFFTSDKTCFAVRMTSTGTIENAMFKHWVAKVEQPKGTYHEALFTNITGSDSVPSPFSTTTMGTTWFNTTFACTKYKVDFTQEYSLNMIPQLSDRSAIRLTWTTESKPTK